MKRKWKHLSKYIVVERKRNDAHEISYYITDKKVDDAEYFYQITRHHWGIENGLHFVKDVVHKEDKNRIKQDAGAMFASLASSVAINMSRKEQEQSITYSQIFFRSNIREALNIIRT